MNENREDLGVYLKDHYAGGVGAIELLEHFVDGHDEPDWKRFYQELLSAIKSDHETLHRLITRLGLEDSILRNAGAWIAEKVGRAKIGFGGNGKNGLGDLAALETLFVGITGKQLLWRALAEVNGTTSFDEDIDFAKLDRGASEQLERVEARRLQVVAKTFGRSLLPQEGFSEPG